MSRRSRIILVFTNSVPRHPQPVVSGHGYRCRKGDDRYFVKYRPPRNYSSYGIFLVFSGIPENRMPLYFASVFLSLYSARSDDGTRTCIGRNCLGGLSIILRIASAVRGKNTARCACWYRVGCNSIGGIGIHPARATQEQYTAGCVC